MNSKITTVLLAILNAGLIGVFFYKHLFTTPAPINHMRLEEILSIRELHLVKHEYNDLFFLHRKGDPRKPVRAIASIPVSITSYLDLREIRLIKSNDSIVKIILPAARLNDPAYALDQMTVQKTRSFQLHAGRDLYPEVCRYLQMTIHQRMDSIRNEAVSNHILEQAEAEGKAYIEYVLRSAGRSDIAVSFGDVEKDARINAYQQRNFLSPVPPLSALPQKAHPLTAVIRSVYH